MMIWVTVIIGGGCDDCGDGGLQLKMMIWVTVIIGGGCDDNNYAEDGNDDEDKEDNKQCRHRW